jgi:ribokinase
MGKILVVGSSNTDMVVKSPKIPRPGETVLGGEFFSFAGGKGANQAVAAAKLGGKVTFLAKLGADELGKNAIKGFERVGIDTNSILIEPNSHSGVALILVDSFGENCISVASGANSLITPSDIVDAKSILQESRFVLTQLEIPMEAVEKLGELAEQLEVPMVLNPAPAQELSDLLFRRLYLITPNETEAEMLTGIKVENENSAFSAAKFLIEKGVKNVIITMGAKGAFFLTAHESGLIPVEKVKVVDTTAAGDTFNGALVVALSEGKDIKDAIKFANRAAAISVTIMGAQDSQPFRNQLEEAS